MKFLKDSFYSVFTVGFRSLSTFVIHKIFAISFGPNGITLLSHFQNLIGIITSIPNDGINKGIIAYLTDKQRSGEDHKRLFVSGILLNIIVFFTGVIVVLFFYQHFINLFVEEVEGYLWFAVVFGAIFFQMFNQYLLSVLVAGKFMKAFFSISILGNIIAISLVYWGAFQYSVSVALIMVALGQASGFLLTLFLFSYKSYLPFRFKNLSWDYKSSRRLGSFILMSLSILFFGKLIDFFVREYVIYRFDLYQTGLWQSVVKISSGYITIFSSLSTMIYYPRVSERLRDYAVLGRFIRRVFVLVVPVIIITLGGIYFFRETVLRILFEKDFVSAAFLMDYQMIGDSLQMISQLLGVVIMAQARTSLFIALQAFSASLYCVLVYYSTNAWGIEGIPIANMLRYIIYLMLVVFFCRKILTAR